MQIRVPSKQLDQRPGKISIKIKLGPKDGTERTDDRKRTPRFNRKTELPYSERTARPRR